MRAFGGVHCVYFALLAIAGNPDKTPLLAFLARFGGGLRFKGIIYRVCGLCGSARLVFAFCRIISFRSQK